MAFSKRSKTTASNAKPTLSIRARLVILVLLAVVPLMFDRVRLLEASRAERIDDVATEALDLARRGADGQSEIITTIRALLQVTARTYVATLANGPACNIYLADLAGSMPWINGMSMIGPEGRIQCSTMQSAVGVDLSDRPHFRTAMETGEFTVSNYLVGRINRRPAVVAIYPTQRIDQNVRAAVIASVDLQWVSALISSLERRPGSSVKLIDGEGTIIAGDAGTTPWIGRKVDQTDLHKALGSREEGTTRAEGLDGVRRIFGFVRVPQSDVRLVVGLNEAEALSRIDRELMLAYVQVGVFGLLVLILAWFGGERLIVAPIRSLARTATRLGRGDLTARPAKEAWAKEFAPLTAALNDMAKKLSDREHELRAANSHLQELATSDALTGLANRRGFDARLGADWQRAGKLGRPVGLLMIDVDHFKLFNDRYGHVEGDVCLRRIAKLLCEVARSGDDLPARYGGEEFAMLLPDAGIDEALAVAERLRNAVEELYIAHASSPCGQVTVSIGVASVVPRIGVAAENLIEAADIGLYESKRRGRNTIVAHGAVLLADAKVSFRAQHQAA
jgi:diguanylate cyclase (GGDEF)-like protein